MHSYKDLGLVNTKGMYAKAIDGKYGTLSEIAYCLMFNVPVIGIETWEIDAPIIKAKSAEEAVEFVFKEILK